MTEQNPLTPPPPHLLKKFSAQAQDETKKRNGAGYLKTFATLCIEWAMNCQSTSNYCQIRSSEIQPSNELVGEWLCDDGYPWDPSENATVTITTNRLKNVATKAAQWGADQELEACCEWLVRNYNYPEAGNPLRAARRPKPPSLKEQALAELVDAYDEDKIDDTAYDIIRRALEALDD